MTLKTTFKLTEIKIRDMEVGDIGIGLDNGPLGYVIIRTLDMFVTISNNCVSCFTDKDFLVYGNCKVRVLTKGESVTLTVE